MLLNDISKYKFCSQSILHTAYFSEFIMKAEKALNDAITKRAFAKWNYYLDKNDENWKDAWFTATQQERKDNC